MHPLFIGPEVLSSRYKKADLFTEIFFINSYLDDYSISSSAFPLRYNSWNCQSVNEEILVVPVTFISGISRIFKKPVHNRIVDNLKKRGFLSDFKYGLASCSSTADQLRFVYDRSLTLFLLYINACYPTCHIAIYADNTILYS